MINGDSEEEDASSWLRRQGGHEHHLPLSRRRADAGGARRGSAATHPHQAREGGHSRRRHPPRPAPTPPASSSSASSGPSSHQAVRLASVGRDRSRNAARGSRLSSLPPTGGATTWNARPPSTRRSTAEYKGVEGDITSPPSARPSCATLVRRDSDDLINAVEVAGGPDRLCCTASRTVESSSNCVASPTAAAGQIDRISSQLFECCRCALSSNQRLLMAGMVELSNPYGG